MTTTEHTKFVPTVTSERFGEIAMITYYKLVELSKAALTVVDFRFCSDTRIDEMILLRNIGAAEQIEAGTGHLLFSVLADDNLEIEQDLRIVRKSTDVNGNVCNDYKAFTEESFRTNEVATTIAQWFGVAKKAGVKHYGSIR
ncbi:hypothetical protein H7171_02035 [Candidatus Saccharibacteria bacterium]|nr:hypothetical protein [Candidatus Saccharibacteria bacterium]